MDSGPAAGYFGEGSQDFTWAQSSARMVLDASIAAAHLWAARRISHSARMSPAFWLFSSATLHATKVSRAASRRSLYSPTIWGVYPLRGTVPPSSGVRSFRTLCRCPDSASGNVYTTRSRQVSGGRVHGGMVGPRTSFGTFRFLRFFLGLGAVDGGYGFEKGAIPGVLVAPWAALGAFLLPSNPDGVTEAARAYPFGHS